MKAVITVPVTWTVSSLNNIGTGSLRQQVTSAHSGDTIVFSNGLTGTIQLSSGEILISNSISILGPGADKLAVNGSGVSRVFDVTNGFSLLAGLCITNGKPSGGGDGGGIIINSGAGLVLSNCLVVGNSTAGNGGGLMNQGALTVWNSLIANNASTLAGHGGGIYNYGTTSVFWNCTISSNSVNIGANPPYIGGGGGVDNAYGTCIFANCTIYSNTVKNASSHRKRIRRRHL